MDSLIAELVTAVDFEVAVGSAVEWSGEQPVVVVQPLVELLSVVP